MPQYEEKATTRYNTYKSLLMPGRDNGKQREDWRPFFLRLLATAAYGNVYTDQQRILLRIRTGICGRSFVRRN